MGVIHFTGWSLEYVTDGISIGALCALIDSSNGDNGDPYAQLKEIQAGTLGRGKRRI